MAAAGWEENQRAAEEEKIEEGMVTLRSQEGMDFVVPTREASLSIFIHTRLVLYGDKHIVPAHGDGDGDGNGDCDCDGDGDDSTKSKYKYTPILLRSITTHVLSKVLHYCKHYYQYHASSSSSSSVWEWDAVHELNHNETLYDLILASDNLRVLPLLDLTCRTLANKIKGMSPREICNILNIKGVFTPQLNDEDHSTASCTFNMVTTTMDVIISNNKSSCVTQDPKLTRKTLDALDILCCQHLTAYDPKRKCIKLNRINMYNLAFFDIYQESSFSRGPPLHKITPKRESVVRSCVNVISIKVCESDVGFPIYVFGTIIARDQVDYRCVYLFRREMNDPQFISSSDNMLSLMDPCRALVPGGRVYFEVDLKIKCDGGMVKDFSKGAEVFDWVRLRTGKETMTMSLCSHLSYVQFLCEQVYRPVEATIAINILNGPCSISRVVASTPGNFKDHIILYEAAGSPIVIASGGSVPLTRRVVAVSLYHKLALFIVGGDVLEHLVLSLGHSDELIRRKMGCAELEVEVAWTSVPVRERPNMVKVVENVRLLL